MFARVFLFEWGYRLRQPVLYVFAALFFFITFMATSTDSFQIGGGIGNVARNAPYIIATSLSAIGFMGIIVLAIFMSTAIARDREIGMSEIFYSTQVGKVSFLTGRFFASVIVTGLCTLAAAFGILLSTFMPFQDPEQIQAFSATPYLYAIFVFVLPNLVSIGCIFFSVAALTRKAIYTYIAMIAMFAFWGVAQSFLGDMDNETLAVLFDPMGLSAFDLVSRYWTVAERNTMLPPLVGPLLLNRVIWITLSCGLLAMTIWRFRLQLRGSGRKEEETDRSKTETVSPMTIPAVNQRFDGRARLGQWLLLTRAETTAVLRSIPFLVVMLFALFNLIGNLSASVGGTATYPVTATMLRRISGLYDLFLLIVVVLFSAELIWRERKTRFHEIHGTLPVGNGILLVSKFTALISVILVSLTLGLVSTVVYQTSQSYFHLEPLLYFKGLYMISFANWILLAAIAFFFQVISRRKYLGFFLIVLYFIANTFLPDTGLEHNLFYFRSVPDFTYSDMNGYGHFVTPILHFNICWAFLGGILLLFSTLLWPRGSEIRLVPAIRGMVRDWNRRNSVVLSIGAGGFLLTGALIFYNTNILNEYTTGNSDEKNSALYEQLYKQYEKIPHPLITGVLVHADIFPGERRADIRGKYTLANKSGETIDQLHLTLNKDLTVRKMSLPESSIDLVDDRLGYRIYNLPEPLEPGTEMTLDFELEIHIRGYANSGSNSEFVENGTFFDNMNYMPRIGYIRDMELGIPSDRRKHGLEGDRRMATRDDSLALMTGFTPDGNWIDFEAVVSTAPDQIAITPGYLQREWIENGRRYFHYKMDAPIDNFYAFLSGRYEVVRDNWKEVAIEIYHHPEHAWNCERMIEALQDGLEYYSENFGPYPYRQIRIIEFPRYRYFAQSFPNTVPYSEGASFITDLRDEENIDMVYYVTAHELAHQWWGDQVVPARVRGGQMLCESLAQYSALMIMEKSFGREEMRRFLAYELNNYLQGRGQERDEELPLVDVEDEAYIYYQKGSLVFYALRDYIGEERLNSALRHLMEETAFREPPYPTSIQLLDYLREVTPERYAYLIEDMFETITLYDNRTEEVEAEEMPNGRYRVRLAFRTHKYRADGHGVETEIDHNDWIEVGVFGEDSDGEEQTLYMEKHRLSSGNGEIEIYVDKQPVRAGIDPRNLFIDRVADDNLKNVSG